MSSANEFHALYKFQVSIWLSGTGKKGSLFERGSWVEQARCMTKQRADEVAICLSLRHPQGVQVAELVSNEQGSRFVGYKFIPETAKDLRDE